VENDDDRPTCSAGPRGRRRLTIGALTKFDVSLCASKADRTMPWCREHGIRIHSDTFVYWNGPGRDEEARLRNFIIRHDLVRAVALPKGMKVEAHRLGYEMSEDALSWNVFESRATAGKPREATHFLTGRSIGSTPRLYSGGV
jgi:hypothetical protein